MNTKWIKLIIDSDIKNVFLIRKVINRLCALTPFSSIDVFQIELCVGESVNNAIKHAYGNESGHQVEITFTLYPKQFTLEISDTGRPMDPKYLPQNGAPCLEFNPDDLDNLPEGRMGLAIINEIMDHVAYTTSEGTNKLILTKNFNTDVSKP
jgi:serine/threonine-protein kinase RsbW